MKRFSITAALAGVSLLVAPLVLLAQQQGPQSQSSETVAKPRKKDSGSTSDTTDNKDLPKIPSQFSKKDKEAPEGLPTFKSDVTTVQLDVAVLDNKGNFIPKIPKGNFRVLEDGVPQPLATFGTSNEAPMTIAMVIEFSNLYQQYWSEGWYETLTAAYGFVQTLKPEDYVAVVAYDMRSEILSDFTTDRMKTQEAMARLRIAGFSEANLFDAVVDTCDRMKDIEGRKAILLIASGRDTFSKLTFDKARKAIQEAGVPIYAISLLQALRIIYDQYMGPGQRMDFLQADNEMRTFAKETGGMAFFPRFPAEYPGIYRAISDSLRNQYSIAYHPTNQSRDGKFRKIKVDLVNPDTNEPLRIVDQKGKPIKYQIVASKQGYNAPREVE
ncbi:MAG TPA: VWA domain-containing protein [Bryobacteraceae bacterium]|nr:VWA domain-containing protein [Bryobacteraceae bacterium]